MSTGIPYADEAVNAKVGCTHSGMPGCDNCWARKLHDMRHAAHLAGKHVPQQYAKPFEETHLLLPERIEKVLHWRKPRRIFWCSTSDIFHKDVPFEFIDQMHVVMALTPQHTHLILTKRVKRALEYYTTPRATGSRIMTESGLRGRRYSPEPAWPLPNVWLGISCSTQKELDEMAPILFQIPAAHRWVSFEPLIEEIRYDFAPCSYYCDHDEDGGGHRPERTFDWVVVGCESGSRRRPCNIEWVRSIVRPCKAAGVAVYVKQLDLGGHIVTDPKDFPADLRIREIPGRVTRDDGR